jgi:hypothetical protein
MTVPSIIWKNIDDDDFICRIGNYCLRVEQMDKKYWWWCVYWYKDEIAFDEPNAKTEKEAKLLAELYFIRHFINHNN